MNTYSMTNSENCTHPIMNVIWKMNDLAKLDDRDAIFDLPIALGTGDNGWGYENYDGASVFWHNDAANTATIITDTKFTDELLASAIRRIESVTLEESTS